MKNLATGTAVLAVLAMTAPAASAADIVHDAEYYILHAQNGERWDAEDAELDAKLAELREKHGQPPNIVYALWDDTAFGAVRGCRKTSATRPPTSTAWPRRESTLPGCTPSPHVRRPEPPCSPVAHRCATGWALSGCHTSPLGSAPTR